MADTNESNNRPDTTPFSGVVQLVGIGVLLYVFHRRYR